MSSNVQSGYDKWAPSYDEIENRTRDLDKIVTKTILSKLLPSTYALLELGCGTGKNTEWLINNAKRLTAVDFSEEMLKKARKKLKAHNLIFKKADITQEWPFENQSFDLITCNLILEHVEKLDFVFSEGMRILQPGGHFFISELHPAKQYLGSKARFELNEEFISPQCFTHHVSDFFSSAFNNGFKCKEFNEWFDDNNRNSVPRLLSILFQK